MSLQNHVALQLMVRLAGTYLLIPFVLSASLLGSFDARELAKIPNIVAHYQHHRTEHGQADMTFLDFLTSHFQSGAAHDDEHENLPLFSGSATAWHLVPLVEVQSDVEHLFHIVMHPAREVERHDPSSGSITPVFQPPRLS